MKTFYVSMILIFTDSASSADRVVTIGEFSATV